MYDILIRSLASIELTILLNMRGVTTPGVVASLCVFLLLEFSALLESRHTPKGPVHIELHHLINVNRLPGLGDLLFTLAYILGIIYLCTTNQLGKIEAIGLAFSIITTILLLYLSRTLEGLRHNLHQTRDDSEELQRLLRSQNVRLRREQDQEVHLATLAERNRIAREIHDNVGHLLSRAILLLGAIRTVSQEETTKPQLAMLADTLDTAMAKMRDSVHDLHDDSIDLRAALEDMTSTLKDFQVSLDLDLDQEIDKDLKLTILGITKEAITNIQKHSNGDQVSIILHRNPGFDTLSITDNGILDSSSKKRIQSGLSDGIGLSNIRERARNYGGQAYFYMDDGFTVYVRLDHDSK